MPPHRLLLSAILALAAIGAAQALAGCGGDDGGGALAVKADRPPVGDPALGSSSRSSGPDRIPITRNGRPVAVYAIKLRDLSEGTYVGGGSSLTVTKCHHTDYDPTQRASTGCVGTRRYRYNPVEVTTQLLLVGDRNGRPDLSDSGIALEDPQTIRCTDLQHHCVPVNIASKQLSSDDVSGGGDRWLILKLAAKSPHATRCDREAKARQCNVLALETQKYTAMYGATSGEAFTALAEKPPADTSANVTRLRTVDDNEPRGPSERVVYSVELAEKGELRGLLGNQLIAEGNLKVSESERFPPLVSGYLVLADSPRRISGRYLSSDTYDAARRGDTGGNCSRRCAYVKPGVATRIARCDVKAGRRYVNLVAYSVRDAARRGESVRVEEGGSLEVLNFPSDADTRHPC
jgi:hypothetical protein